MNKIQQGQIEQRAERNGQINVQGCVRKSIRKSICKQPVGGSERDMKQRANVRWQSKFDKV
eukprot:11126588-Karenia_brevis.AAC.1